MLMYNVHIMDIILPNGKVINYNNTLYYGANKTQIATNNQILSLQTQITDNNNNLQNQINNMPIILQSSKTVTGAQHSGYSIYTLPSGYRFCAFIIKGSYNFSSGATSNVPDMTIYFTNAIDGEINYSNNVNLINIDGRHGSDWPYVCMFFYYPALNVLQYTPTRQGYTLQDNNIYLSQNNTNIINNINITGYCFK